MMMAGSLHSSSVVLPQRPPSGVSLGSLNVCLQVLLQSCSTTICGWIGRTCLYRDKQEILAILWGCESCNCNNEEFDRRNASCLGNAKPQHYVNLVPSVTQGCAAVSAFVEVSQEAAQRSQLLRNVTILQDKSHSILNSPPWVQELSEPPENTLTESESTLLSSGGAWKHLAVLRSTGEVDWSAWEVWVCVWDRFTLCWCRYEGDSMHYAANWCCHLPACRAKFAVENANWQWMQIISNYHQEIKVVSFRPMDIKEQTSHTITHCILDRSKFGFIRSTTRFQWSWLAKFFRVRKLNNDYVSTANILEHAQPYVRRMLLIVLRLLMAIYL
jgi:hypothetical protein